MSSLSSIITLLVLVLIGFPIAVVVMFLVNRNRLNQLQLQVGELRKQVGDLRMQAAQRAATEAPNAVSAEVQAESTPPAAAAEVPPDAAEEPPPDETPEPSPAVTPAATREPPPPEIPEQQTAAAASMPPVTPRISDDQAPRGKNPADHLEDFLRRISDAVVSYFTDGNVFVRIGLLVLFFGVAFLLKYAADNSNIPLEVRFMGAAIGGMLLLVTGWRLRARKEIYALLLQGGGIGITYITIFAAFRLAHLLPSSLTFALLVFFAGFTVALAILQDSRALAIYALIGGFLAPFLASSGSGNYVGLFSYYAVLNAAVIAVAWFRAWRSLNLLGFIFTFGVFVLWVIFDYSDADLYPASAFLLLFFLMYSLIGVLYALRQPQHLTGLVDGTLVFGTPVIVSGLLMGMLRNYEYGIAGASAGMGFYYIVLARYCWKNIGEDFRLLAEAMLAIGVVFATLAIPYALEGHWSSAAWALEAAGILWVSIRQRRFYAQCFAILLQVGSGALFLVRNFDDVGSSAWLNPAFLGGVFIALGAFVSARMLYRQPADFKLRLLHIPFYLWAMGWWLGSAMVQIDHYISNEVVALLILFGATAMLLVYLDRIREWDWMPASINAALLLPVLILLAVYSLFDNGHLLVTPDVYAWIPLLAMTYWMITRLESVDWPVAVNILLHTVFIVFVALLLSVELLWLADDRIAGLGEGFYALLALGPLLAMHAALDARFPAIARFGPKLQFSIITALGGVMLVWGLLINASNSGDPAPLPYLLFLNPVDLAHLAFFMLLLGGMKLLTPDFRVSREQVIILVASLAFIWLTAVLIRSMHHFLDIRFDLSTLLGDTRVQTAISILWTVIGMVGMLFASRRSVRSLWIVAAALVGIVLFKMFFVDLGASGTVERIVSFLVVGSLLVATGYFSPIPQKDAAADTRESSHA